MVATASLVFIDGIVVGVRVAGVMATALAMARAAVYDVVLCDLMMPSGGAESWLAGCRTIDPHLDARTIVLTGGPTTEAAASLVHARPGRVLLEPVDIRELRALIEQLVRSAPVRAAAAHAGM